MNLLGRALLLLLSQSIALADLLPEVVTLGVMGLVLLVLSAVQFHKKLV